MTEPFRPTGRASLYRIDGSRRPDAEILAEAGKIGLRLALLDDAMHRRASSAEADSLYPPRLFLSYKWGVAEEDAWVGDLAEMLTARGWDVVFDRERDESVDRTVEEFVSRLMSCRVFVAVLSPAYIASAFQPSHPTWVFDEMQCALIARDRMRIIGIVPPPGLAKPRPPRAAGTCPCAARSAASARSRQRTGPGSERVACSAGNRANDAGVRSIVRPATPRKPKSERARHAALE